MSKDETDTSITFKCPQYLKDALNLYARRHGLPMGPFLRQWTENQILKDMVIDSRKRCGFVITVKKLQSEISLDEWDEANAMTKSKPKKKVVPLVRR